MADPSHTVRPPGWHGKRRPYGHSKATRDEAVRLAAFTIDDDGLPLGIHEASRRTGVPAQTVAWWVKWTMATLGLEAEWAALRHPMQTGARAGRRIKR